MADYEYKSPDQVPISWGESLNMVTKSPAVAKRIFLSKDDAQEYIDDAGSNATPGIRLTVLTDYIKDPTPTYTAGHFAFVKNAWVSAEGFSTGNTYQPGNEGERSGVYWVKTVGDGVTPGTLVKLGADGTGIQGPQGAEGAQGAAGNIWIVQGLQGLQGTEGYPGMIVTGVVGDNGEVGIQGIQGTSGTMGLTVGVPLCGARKSKGWQCRR